MIAPLSAPRLPTGQTRSERRELPNTIRREFGPTRADPPTLLALVRVIDRLHRLLLFSTGDCGFAVAAVDRDGPPGNVASATGTRAHELAVEALGRGPFRYG